MAADLGYAVIPGILSDRECDGLTETLSTSALRRSRAGARHLMNNAAASALASDSRLISLARQWLGNQAVPFRATLFEKSAATNWLIPWHQDTALPLVKRFDQPGWASWSEKAGVAYAHAPAWALSRVIALRIHLDGSDSGNGPLRVIPGSHACGVLTDQAVAEAVSSLRAVECCVPRGGVIAMRPLTVHSSPKARSDRSRRVLHIEYADSLCLAAGIQLAVV